MIILINGGAPAGINVRGNSGKPSMLVGFSNGDSRVGDNNIPKAGASSIDTNPIKPYPETPELESEQRVTFSTPSYVSVIASHVGPGADGERKYALVSQQNLRCKSNDSSGGSDILVMWF